MIQQSGKPLVAVGRGAYSTEIIYSSAQFSQLSQESRHLLAERSSTCDPHFFLASVQRNIWSPLAVVVSRDGVTIGIVYAKELQVAGFRLGLIYGDATLDAMVVADSAHRESVFEVALNRLIDRRGSRGLRLLIPSVGFERRIIQRVLDSRPLDVHYSTVEHHCVLELGHSYDTFLQKLSKKTRRNFRYHRRRFEALGHTFIERVPLADFERASSLLLAKDVVGASRVGVNRALGMLAAVKDPILVGLRHQSGEWLSILGGWYEGDCGVVFFQMNNDRDYPQSAFYLVLRGYLIEAMIAAEIPRMLFWDGVGPPLCRYCEILPATGVHLDLPNFGWRTSRRLIGWTTHFLPARLRSITSWVAPGLPSRHSEIL